MKITKETLRQIIKEELESVQQESLTATEYELYSELLAITESAKQFQSKLNVAMGLTASGPKTSEISDELFEKIRSAIFGLDTARTELAQAIGQDPAPELAQVRE